jgi:hypothetical protein
MGNAKGGGWGYTARYGWNWRSARTVGAALGSLALPMPPWFRPVVARCLLTRTALHADAEGIRGSAGPQSTGSAGPCAWKDVTDIAVWNYDHLRIIGIARRGDAVGAGPAALASRAPRPSRPTRRRAFRRHPSYPAFIAPDGSPYNAANVVTTNGRCVDTARLQATVRHYAPHARFVDLTGARVGSDDGPLLFAFALEVLAGLPELIGWRRLGWLLGVAAAIAVLVAAAANLGTQGGAPIGVIVGALALALLIGRAAVVRRRRRLAAHPESWLESGREDAEGSPLARLRRGRLAAWTLRVSSRGGRRARLGRRLAFGSAGWPLAAECLAVRATLRIEKLKSLSRTDPGRLWPVGCQRRPGADLAAARWLPGFPGSQG